MLYMLDTNICIAGIRNNPSVIARMKSLTPNDCALSIITVYELQVGIYKCDEPLKESAKLDYFLAGVHVLRFDLAAANEAARLRAILERQGMKIGAYDALLAGHASALGATFVTANVGEFGRIPSLTIENWLA